MTISSTKHAMKMLARTVHNGPIGTHDCPVLNVIVKGRAPSCNERRFFFEAIDRLEERKAIFVVRDETTGIPVTIDTYDCSRAVIAVEVVEEKPRLTRIEALVVLHEALQQMANDENLVFMAKTQPEFEDFLTTRLGETYQVTKEDVHAVMTVLHWLDLRSNSKHLRGVGMSVAPIDLRAVFSSNTPGTERLTHEVDQLQGKVESLEEELRSTRSEMSRQERDCLEIIDEKVELIRRNDELELANAKLMDFKKGIAAMVNENI